MTLAQVEKQALALYNKCCLFGSSYRSVLETMYETASEKKQYVKCSLIQELIRQDINS